jgi:hypothetical protein
MKPMHETFHLEHVRRRADGSIDIEFYRRRALLMRAQMLSSAAVTLWRELTALGRIVSSWRPFRRMDLRAPGTMPHRGD